MFYSREKIQLLGRYFKYCREKNNITIKQITSSCSCDFKTYKKIENGIIKNNEELLDRVLEFFGLDFSIVNTIEDINSFIDKLYNACEYYDKVNIANLSNRIKNKLYLCKDKPLIKEMVVSINIIQDYYMNDECLTESEILKTIPFIQLWDNKLSSLLIEVVENSNLNDVISIDISKYLKNIISKKDSIQKYWYARECITALHYNEALEIYNDLEIYFKEKNNIKRSINVLLKQFLIYRDIDYNKADEYAGILSNLIDGESISNDKKAKIFFHLAIYHYFRNNYSDSLLYFEKSNELNRIMRNTIFICACRSRLDKILNYEFVVEEEHTLYLYLNYFKMKANNETPQNLEGYIMNEVLDKLMEDNYTEPFWSMFDYELRSLVKKTRNYKKYHEFQEKLQFTTETAA